MEENIVFEYDFGFETYGKILLENESYQCYETPLFGGDFIKVGKLYRNLDEAILFLKSLT